MIGCHVEHLGKQCCVIGCNVKCVIDWLCVFARTGKQWYVIGCDVEQPGVCVIKCVIGCDIVEPGRH